MSSAARSDDPPPPVGAARAIGVITIVAVVTVVAVMGAARLVPAPAEAAPTVLTPGDRVAEVLRGGPTRYVIEGRAGDVLTVDMAGTSEGLDAYLTVIGPSGDVLGEDDDGGSGLDARLRVTLAEDGEHVVVASFVSASRGGYELGVQLVPAGDLAPAEVVLDERVESRAGAPAELAFDAPAGATLRIRTERDGGDPYLRLRGPDGDLVDEDDDSGGDLDAELVVTAPTSGTYVLEVDNLQDDPAWFGVTVEVEVPLT